jgi:hypothetical protein
MWSSSPRPCSKFNSEKNFRHPKSRNFLQNTWPVLLKNVTWQLLKTLGLIANIRANYGEKLTGRKTLFQS